MSVSYDIRSLVSCILSEWVSIPLSAAITFLNSNLVSDEINPVSFYVKILHPKHHSPSVINYECIHANPLAPCVFVCFMCRNPTLSNWHVQV